MISAEEEVKHNVNILVNGVYLSFELDKERESVMREAASRLQETENGFRIKAKLSDDSDYFRYAALLVASNLIKRERDKRYSDETISAQLDEILDIVSKY